MNKNPRIPIGRLSRLSISALLLGALSLCGAMSPAHAAGELSVAAAGGDIQGIQYYFKDASPAERNEAIVDAAQNGQTKSIELLLKLGVSIDARDSRGLTALMAAAAGDQPDAVELLVRKGANPKSEFERDSSFNINGITVEPHDTAEKIASREEHPTVLRALTGTVVDTPKPKIVKDDRKKKKAAEKPADRAERSATASPRPRPASKTEAAPPDSSAATQDQPQNLRQITSGFASDLVKDLKGKPVGTPSPSEISRSGGAAAPGQPLSETAPQGATIPKDQQSAPAPSAPERPTTWRDYVRGFQHGGTLGTYAGAGIGGAAGGLGFMAGPAGLATVPAGMYAGANVGFFVGGAAGAVRTYFDPGWVDRTQATEKSYGLNPKYLDYGTTGILLLNPLKSLATVGLRRFGFGTAADALANLGAKGAVAAGGEAAAKAGTQGASQAAERIEGGLIYPEGGAPAAPAAGAGAAGAQGGHHAIDMNLTPAPEAAAPAAAAETGAPAAQPPAGIGSRVSGVLNSWGEKLRTWGDNNFVANAARWASGLTSGAEASGFLKPSEGQPVPAEPGPGTVPPGGPNGQPPGKLDFNSLTPSKILFQDPKHPKANQFALSNLAALESVTKPDDLNAPINILRNEIGTAIRKMCLNSSDDTCLQTQLANCQSTPNECLERAQAKPIEKDARAMLKSLLCPSSVGPGAAASALGELNQGTAGQAMSALQKTAAAQAQDTTATVPATYGGVGVGSSADLAAFCKQKKSSSDEGSDGGGGSVGGGSAPAPVPPPPGAPTSAGPGGAPGLPGTTPGGPGYQNPPASGSRNSAMAVGALTGWTGMGIVGLAMGASAGTFLAMALGGAAVGALAVYIGFKWFSGK